MNLSLVRRRAGLMMQVMAGGRRGELWNMLRAGCGVVLEPILPSYEPLFAVVEPTSRCNLRCTTCVNASYESRTDMPLDRFRLLLERFRFLRKIALTGVGEPLMNRELFAMIAAAKARGIQIGFTTNGMLLNEKNIVTMLESGVDWFSVSIDSPVPETYEKIRGGASFHRVVDNVRRFMELSDGRLEPNILMVCSPDTYQQIPDFLPLLEYMGVRQLDLQSMHNWGRSGTGGAEEQRSQLKLCQDFNDIIEKTKANALIRGLTVNYMNPIDMEVKRQCKWPWRSTYVSTDGLVTPCCLGGADPRTLQFGNVFEVESYQDIWCNEGYQAFRRHLASKTPPAICRGCPNY